jgi:hypothetical protein
MSKRSVVVLIVVALVGTACWFCSEALWDAVVAMHQRGGS